MSAQDKKLQKLREIINENLRTQLDNDKVNYISTGHTLSDVATKQSHCIFARRGCGKTLLLHHSRRVLEKDTKAIYINCEDFKHHSFPNVLIEILQSTFRELDRNLYGWFGKSKKVKSLLEELLASLDTLRAAPDVQMFNMKTSESSEEGIKSKIGAKLGAQSSAAEMAAQVGQEKLFATKTDIEKNTLTMKINCNNLITICLATKRRFVIFFRFQAN